MPRRFGRLALVAEREEAFPPGAVLLQVTHGNRVVSAAVLSEWRNAMCCLSGGLAQGLEADLAEAAFAGLYYFSIQHAYTRGCREVNLSYTRPVLDDGIYWYKRKWGTSVHDVWRERELLLRPTGLLGGIQSFFVHHPLLIRHNRHSLASS
jgi:lipid II:glycine glycyltransferase (peptidoglycan interpeptide bridge formation enzyme)